MSKPEDNKQAEAAKADKAAAEATKKEAETLAVIRDKQSAYARELKKQRLMRQYPELSETGGTSTKKKGK